MVDTRISEGYGIDAGTNTGRGLASELAGMTDESAQSSFGCSQEQIFSPIQIKKNAVNVSDELPAIRKITLTPGEKGNFGSRTSTPGEGGVVPYAEDLDPYFFGKFGEDDTAVVEKGDFALAIMKSDDEEDLAVARNNNVSEVRTMGLRGPLLMSGWGYDISDRPVPKVPPPPEEIPNPDYDAITNPNVSPTIPNPNYPPAKIPNPNFNNSEPPSASNPEEIDNPARDGDSFAFSKELGQDRSKWKTGPVHLMWDEDRQVWAGGLPMLMGVAIEDITAPEDPANPTEFKIEVLRYDKRDADGESEFTSQLKEVVVLKNRDPSVEQELITKNRKNPTENPLDPTADPPGKHSWPDNPSLVWVMAVKMNYEWVPFYVGCPDECQSPQHCADMYGDDPFYVNVYGEAVVSNPAHWVCEDGKCKFVRPVSGT